MNSLDNKLSYIIENTCFLAKNSLSIGNYLFNSHRASVISYSGQHLTYLKNRHQVDNHLSSASSKNFFKRTIKEYSPPYLFKNIWAYEPYEWFENYENININIFTNSYYLFRRYSNKFNQKFQLLKYGNQPIRDHMSWQMKKFNEKVNTRNEKVGMNKVVRLSSHTEGGVDTCRKNSATPSLLNPIYETDYCNFDIGITQLAIVFQDGVVLMQPARYWNGKNSNEFALSCEYYDPKIGQYCDLDKVCDLTKNVGYFLSKNGYRGAFGCDYLYDSSSHEIYFCEANLRYTADIALFVCSSKTEKSTFQNILNPHSLHFLAFLETKINELPNFGSSQFVSFSEAGGGNLKTFYDAGAFKNKNKTEEYYQMTIESIPNSLYLSSSVFL